MAGFEFDSGSREREDVILHAFESWDAYVDLLGREKDSVGDIINSGRDFTAYPF